MVEAAWWVLNHSPRQGVCLQMCWGKLTAVTLRTHSEQLAMAAHMCYSHTLSSTPHDLNCLLPLFSLYHFKHVPSLQRSSRIRNLDTLVLICEI